MFRIFTDWRIEMKKQIVSLIAASLIGASATAFGENDRDRSGGWWMDDDHVQHQKHDHSGRGGHKDKSSDHKRVVIKEKKHGKHKGRHKRTQESIVIIKKSGHHKHGWRHGHHAGPKFAEVLKVKPIRKVTRKTNYLPSGKCRFGGRSHRGYESTQFLELVLGGLSIQANKHKHHDCKRIVKEVHTDYRVTYRYRGTRHVVHMNNHPGDYVRVNRFGELIQG